MSVDSYNQLDGWNCVQDALVEIGSSSHELQEFVADLFDQLGRSTDELLLGELSRQRAEHQAERDAFEGHIERFAALTAELADTVAEQKKLGV